MKNSHKGNTLLQNILLFIKEFVIVILVTLLTLAIQRKVWPNEISVKIERVIDTNEINITICQEFETKQFK